MLARVGILEESRWEPPDRVGAGAVGSGVGMLASPLVGDHLVPVFGRNFSYRHVDSKPVGNVS